MTTLSSTDRIHKEITLKASPSRVWQALTDPEQFGAWFRVKFEGAFAVGRQTRGQITYPGYEHVRMEVFVEAIYPQTLIRLSAGIRHAIDMSVDYGAEPTTLVELHRAPAGTGTRLTVTEGGFDRLPAARRDEARLG